MGDMIPVSYFRERTRESGDMTLFSRKGIVSPEFPKPAKIKIGNGYHVPDLI
jgi:hypothetical protein